MLSSFYDGDIKMRGSTKSGADPSATFKIRNTGRFKPNITEMKSTAGQPRDQLASSQRNLRKTDATGWK